MTEVHQDQKSRKRRTADAQTREAVVAVERVNGEYEREQRSIRERVLARETISMLKLHELEVELKRVLLEHRHGLLAAANRMLDYCLAGTIRVTERDLQGLLHEKIALSDNLKACQELNTKQKEQIQALQTKLHSSAVVAYGQDGTGTLHSMQEPFKPARVCRVCGRPARLVVTVSEQNRPTETAASHSPGDGGIWPHDYAAFAVYICGACGEATAEWNQS